jgi:hypothetical protein
MELERKIVMVLGALALNGGCGSDDHPARELKVEVNVPARTHECLLRADVIRDDGMGFDHSCGCGEPTPERWWGKECERPSGGGMSLNIGDCVLLGKYFYCLSESKIGGEATLLLSFERDSEDRLLRIK